MGCINSKENIDTPTDRTFTLFPNLPLELQRKIWELASISRRAIEIQTRYKNNANRYLTYAYERLHIDRRLHVYINTPRLPSFAFHASHESRRTALRHTNFLTFLGRPLYCNQDTDILWIRDDPIPGMARWLWPNIYSYAMITGKESIVLKYPFRYLAIDMHARIHPRGNQNGPPGALPETVWMKWFSEYYVMQGIWLEKIFVVYREEGEREEAVREAGEIRNQAFKDAKTCEHMEGPYPVEINVKAFKLRRKMGTWWKIPAVEAVLDTELLQQW